MYAYAIPSNHHENGLLNDKSGIQAYLSIYQSIYLSIYLSINHHLTTTARLFTLMTDNLNITFTYLCILHRI